MRKLRLLRIDYRMIRRLIRRNVVSKKRDILKNQKKQSIAINSS